MAVTPIIKASQKFPRNSTNNNGKSSSSGLLSSWVVILVLIIVFFRPESASIGLPGTKNILTNLKNEAHDFLRKEEKRLEKVLKNTREASAPETHADSLAAPASLIKTLSLLRSGNDATTPPITKTDSLVPPLKSSFDISSVKKKIFDRSFSSVAVNDNCYVAAPSNIDDNVLLITSWVYLDESTTHDNDMRTIYSNKSPGCEPSSKQNGISLYINGWQTKDHKLYFEYGGSHSGCSKVIAEDRILTIGQWHHIGSFITRDRIILFVDGDVVANREIADPHVVQSSAPLLFGQYSPEAPYTLFGNLSDVLIFRNLGEQSSDDITKIVQSIYVEGAQSVLKSSKSLFVYYPLDYGKGLEIARELKQKLNARYQCFDGSGVGGLKIRLVDGVNDRPVTDEMRKESDRQGEIHKQKIIEGMKHVWHGYKSYAWGRDELKPISNHGQDNWGGIGMTILDSLDTLWIMGMKQEFNEGVQWVKNSLHFAQAGSVSVFEITIRALGGLLSAYDLSKEQVLLEKAKDLGERLIRAFQTRSGIPTGMIHLGSGSPSGGWAGNNAILSELGTLQVEFRYLAQHTGLQYLEDTSMKPLKLMAHKNPSNGLYPIKVRIDDGGFADSMITFGALGDSFYEYLLKLWLQGGRKETWLRELYDRAMDGAINKLLMASSPSGYAFFSDWNGHSNFRKMDHLVCFVPGLLALGAYTDPIGIDSPRAIRDLKVAKALMYTCREMYHRTSTGIAPEFVEFPAGRDMITAGSAPFYILRPETAESLFILNQLTGDPIYREWAWEIWEAIDRECRTGSAYGSLRNVNNRGAGIDDRMESFFLAETIKYLYLAQDPDKPVDLMKVVFNTEAHPMSIFDDSHKPVML